MSETKKPLDAAMATEPSNLAHGELLYMMHELSRLISTYFDNAMEPHNLTHSQWWALMHISENEGQTQSDLARIMQMGRAATSKLLERLEAKGWIERRPDKADQRVLRIHLKEGSIPIFGVMQTEGVVQFNKLLKDVSEEHELAALGTLRKIKANAERAIKAQSAPGH